jgi:tRNA A-37 threonylcarbamoyl transferase component Bud32
MTIEKPYPSMVNSVFKYHQGTHARVRKVYGEVAIKTGVSVPLERKLIEERMLRIIGSADFLGFKVPKILGSGDRHLDFELLAGPLALDTLEEPYLPERVERWRSIGASLAQAEVYLQNHATDIFHGLTSIQKQCAQIMGNRKHKGVSVGKENEHLWVSMGDVGIRNIIIGRTDTYMLDFEFAHLSRRARDAGQLISQLESTGANELSKAVETGYLTIAEFAEVDLNFWKSTFTKYYVKAYGKN